MAVLLVVAVVAVAYGSQPPAVAVAEFSPAARQAVAAPPTTGAGEAARGAAGRRNASTTSTRPPGVSGSTTTTANPAGTTLTPRGRPCHGNPPRQSDDVHSPPCIATIFDGDNGGATSPGVNGTEVRVAVPFSGARDKVAFDTIFEYFNREFEFYGRRLVPVYLPYTATGDPTTARAQAAEIVPLGVFGALPTRLDWLSSLRPAFFNELARNGIVSVTLGLGGAYTDDAVFDELHPYVWSVYPSLEQVERNLADFACRSLAGKPARFAGATDLRSTNRVFGVVASGLHTIPKTRDLVEGIRACGARVEVTDYDAARDSADVLRTGLQAMKDAGVTTVTCICTNQGHMGSITSTATTVGFAPEWLLSVDQYPAAENLGQLLAAGARPHALLFSERGRSLPVQAHTWYRALPAVNPTIFTGTTARSDFSVVYRAYPAMLLLASGIQAAGPMLTPDTFAAALMALQFPNPGAGQAPYWQPAVGFGPGDHSFYSDYALASWSESLPALEPFFSSRAQGSWCYLDRGARFSAGQFPSDADSRFFGPDTSCR